MTSGDMIPRTQVRNLGRQLSPEQAAVAAVIADASARGLELTGPDGPLKLFTKTVLETALAEEMTEHLGHEKNRAPADRETSNIRNGSRTKTVVSEAAGEVEISVPRDREGTFEPKIVKRRQRRLSGVDEIVLSLYAKGLTTGEISAHFEEIYGASVSKETVSQITDAALGEMHEWSSRPLDRVYVAIFIDAVVVEIRDGQVGNRPVYAAIGVTVDGHKDGLGPVGGHRRRGRQVLDVRAHRPAEPRCRRRARPCVRPAPGRPDIGCRATTRVRFSKRSGAQTSGTPQPDPPARGQERARLPSNVPAAAAVSE